MANKKQKKAKKIFKTPGIKPGLTKYIPEVVLGDWDNRKEENPIIVWINIPTEREKRIFWEENRESKPEEIWEKAVIEFCDHVDNYEGRAGMIKTGADLVEHGFSSIVVDAGYFAVMMTELEKKTSEQPSGF